MLILQPIRSDKHLAMFIRNGFNKQSFKGIRRNVCHRTFAPGNNRIITNIMYAIVEIGGQQFKVEQGKSLFVHRLKDAEEGQTVEFEKVLLVGNEGTVSVGTPTVSGAKVVCEIVHPLVKGDKVIVFHMKRRKSERKRNGHREHFTELKVKELIA